MSADRPPGNATEIVDALFAFVADPEQEIEEMSPDGVRAYLRQEKIDIESGKRTLRQRLGVIQGQQRLARARQRRQEFEQELAQWESQAGKRKSGAKAELIRKLKSYGEGQPEQAVVYFRRLEHAAEADIEAMLADLRVLERAEGDGDEAGD